MANSFFIDIVKIKIDFAKLQFHLMYGSLEEALRT